jgi:SAM-dependent methyltransferase
MDAPVRNAALDLSYWPGREAGDEPAYADPPVPLPEYLSHTYTWAYLDPKNAERLDREFVVNAILWGNYRRLVRAACAEFRPGEHVLQAASVYGRQPEHLVQRLGPGGRLEVIDVSPLQVARLRRKLAAYPNASVRVADAAAPGTGSYDAVCCFFLLHEMPDDYKRRVVNALLARVKPGGRVVFVDYARPRWFHPLRGLMALVNAWLEPYAASLWRHPIRFFAEQPDSFRWRERRLFLGLYQVVVAEHPRRLG